MDDRLAGKVVWLTGGSRGIGEAAALACARAGGAVAISSRKDGPLVEAAARIQAAVPGARVLPVACHVGQAEALAEAVAKIEGELGPIDALINNAATNPYFGPLIRTPDNAWEKTFEVNVKGPFMAARLVIDRLVARKAPGSIVNVTSIQGFRAAPFQGVYGMTKAALISMTRTLAFEMGSMGIRVNAVAPGLIETRFASVLTGTPDILRRYTDRAPLGRVGAPEEIAGLLVHLASDESSYTTGQVFTADGGFTSI